MYHPSVHLSTNPPIHFFIPHLPNLTYLPISPLTHQSTTCSPPIHIPPLILTHARLPTYPNCTHPSSSFIPPSTRLSTHIHLPVIHPLIIHPVMKWGEVRYLEAPVTDILIHTSSSHISNALSKDFRTHFLTEDGEVTSLTWATVSPSQSVPG